MVGGEVHIEPFQVKIFLRLADLGGEGTLEEKVLVCRVMRPTSNGKVVSREHLVV
jgi:hypothetical protein